VDLSVILIVLQLIYLEGILSIDNAAVLGDMTEQALRQSLIMSQGSGAIFFNRPIALTFVLAAAFLFLLPAFRGFWSRRRGRIPQPMEA
jgi:TctA family transporter